ncbi:presenilin [Plakobranchus ocellatus]|uniref:Presenilin n=1 Tax=Plakobranchus ocellatus TaxID=259542 RepID=A0AAV3YWP9_9GAST|nr:presenilin [Plakobranchus ocellatus]
MAEETVDRDNDDDDCNGQMEVTPAGPDLNDIVEALPDSELQAIGDESPFDKLVSALNQHFNPKVNKEIQRYQFRRMSQTTELIDDFYTALRHLAPSCVFTHPEEEIKSQIIAGCRSLKVREKSLNNPNITLTNLLQFARTCELTQKHAQQVEKEFTTVNKLGLAKQRPKHDQNHEKPLTHKNCRNCGRKWPHEGGQKNCPAYNKTCNSCGKANHFASVCKSKTTQPRQVKTKPKQKLNFRKHVHTIQDESASEDDYVFMSAISRKGMPVFEIEISGRHTELLADSGASVNILPEQVYNALPTQPALEPCMNRIFPFSSSQPLEVVGKL